MTEISVCMASVARSSILTESPGCSCGSRERSKGELKGSHLSLKGTTRLPARSGESSGRRRSYDGGEDRRGLVGGKYGARYRCKRHLVIERPEDDRILLTGGRIRWRRFVPSPPAGSRRRSRELTCLHGSDTSCRRRWPRRSCDTLVCALDPRLLLELVDEASNPSRRASAC